MAKRRVGRYPREFRQMAVARMSSSDNISALSEELGVDRKLLYRWRGQMELTPPAETVEASEGAPPEDPRESRLRQENSQLKRALADKSLEVDFFKGALQKVAARRQPNKSSGERASTTRSGE